MSFKFHSETNYKWFWTFSKYPNCSEVCCFKFQIPVSRKRRGTERGSSPGSKTFSSPVELAFSSESSLTGRQEVSPTWKLVPVLSQSLCANVKWSLSMWCCCIAAHKHTCTRHHLGFFCFFYQSNTVQLYNPKILLVVLDVCGEITVDDDLASRWRYANSKHNPSQSSPARSCFHCMDNVFNPLFTAFQLPA